jgi:hypothetical protein
MKLNEINKESISKVSNNELVSLHRRLHQLFGSISRFPKPNKKVKSLLLKIKKVHGIIVSEMLKRNLKHQSDFVKREEISMTGLDKFLDYVLEDDSFVFREEGIMIPELLRLGELLLEKRKEKWIQKAIEKPGSLHAALDVPQGEKIPAEKLAVKPGDTPKMKRRKILAKTLKKISSKRR